MPRSLSSNLWITIACASKGQGSLDLNRCHQKHQVWNICAWTPFASVFRSRHSIKNQWLNTKIFEKRFLWISHICRSRHALHQSFRWELPGQALQRKHAQLDFTIRDYRLLRSLIVWCGLAPSSRRQGEMANRWWVRCCRGAIVVLGVDQTLEKQKMTADRFPLTLI